VPRTPMVLTGPTQDELLQQLSTGKISVDQFKALSAGVSAKIDLAVSGNEGWLSIYTRRGRFLRFALATSRAAHCWQSRPPARRAIYHHRRG